MHTNQKIILRGEAADDLGKWIRLKYNLGAFINSSGSIENKIYPMKKLRDLRIKIIQFLIDINEKSIFYPRLKKFYKSNFSKSNPIIFDVGSNKGQSIDFFTEIYKDAIIYAFEPNKNLFKSLKNKYKNNPNIHIFNLGVSNSDSVLEFKECVMDETSTFEDLNYSSLYLKNKSKILGLHPNEIIKSKYLVQVVKLSQFIRDENIKNIDILKIDTEGHELKCLQGLFDGLNLEFSLGFIQLEYHNDDMYISIEDRSKIFTLLMDYGFDNKVRIKHGFGNLDEYVFFLN